MRIMRSVIAPMHHFPAAYTFFKKLLHFFIFIGSIQNRPNFRVWQSIDVSCTCLILSGVWNVVSEVQGESMTKHHSIETSVTDWRSSLTHVDPTHPNVTVMAMVNAGPSAPMVPVVLGAPSLGGGSSSGKDSRWLTLEVCREFARSKCSRTDEECKYAHPPPHVDIQNGRVMCCFDSIKVYLFNAGCHFTIISVSIGHTVCEKASRTRVYRAILFVYLYKEYNVHVLFCVKTL